MGIHVMEGGGKVAPGDTFDWENYSDSPCTITDTSAFLTASSYQVPAKTGPNSPGTTPATVKTGIADQNYPYSASNNKKRTNPTIHVESGKP
jgi:hypothetical protein